MRPDQLALWEVRSYPLPLEEALDVLREAIAGLAPGPERTFAEAKLAECGRWARYAAHPLTKPEVVIR
jgi:hypothetical protein